MFKWFGKVNFSPYTKVTEFAQHLKDGSLMASKCKKCGATSFPPRADCGECMSDEFEFFEISGKAFLFIELKFADAPVKDGQRILLSRVVDAISAPGRAAVAMIARHDADIGIDIDAGAAVVTEYYWAGRWRRMEPVATARELTERFFRRFAPDELARLTGGASAGRR